MEQRVLVRRLYLPTGGLTAGSVAGVVSMVTPGGGVFGERWSPGSAEKIIFFFEKWYILIRLY